MHSGADLCEKKKEVAILEPLCPRRNSVVSTNFCLFKWQEHIPNIEYGVKSEVILGTSKMRAQYFRGQESANISWMKWGETLPSSWYCPATSDRLDRGFARSDFSDYRGIYSKRVRTSGTRLYYEEWYAAVSGRSSNAGETLVFAILRPRGRYFAFSLRARMSRWSIFIENPSQMEGASDTGRRARLV